MDKLTELFREEIKGILREKGCSAYKASVDAGKPANWLSNQISTKRSETMTLSNLAEIAKVLGLRARIVLEEDEVK